MTDLRKAAEMALEALERCGSENYVIEREATAALRQALAQPVDAVNMSQECVDETAKREHEPVAWVKLESWVSGESWPDDCFSHFQCTGCVPLYTAPPKREWVGLTDADKQEAFDETQEASGGFWEFADYLEAKLRERNG